MAGGTSSRNAGPLPRPAKRDPARVRSAEPARFGLTQRRSAAAARVDAAQSLQRFVRQEYWNGLAAGDVVRVAGHTARGRHWRFRAHITNSSNGATWVEVALVDGPPPARRPAIPGAGGAPDDSMDGVSSCAPRVEKVRSFDPTLVTPRWRGRGRVASMLRAAAQPDGRAMGAKPAQEEHAEELSNQSSLF